MLFYLILVFFQIQALVNSSELPGETDETDETDETKLIVAVINLKKQFQGDTSEHLCIEGNCSHEISNKLLQDFMYVVRVLLNQVSNIHHKTLLDKETALAIKEKYKDTYAEMSYTYVFEKTEFENNVCSLMMRCLDFIYDFSTTVTELYTLYKTYFLHCVNWTHYIDQYFSWNVDTQQYLYDIDQVIQLHEHVTEYPEQSMRDGFANRVALFVEVMFEYINNIDKVTILRRNQLISKPKRVLGDVTDDDFTNLRQKFVEYKLEDEANTILEQKLGELNAKYNNIILEQLTVADTVNRIVTHAFKMLRPKFESEIDKTLQVKYTKDNFIEAVENIFNEFCAQAPLVMIYVMGNCSDNEFPKTHVPYGLQLAYCNNWLDILKNRCPHIPDKRKERACMVKTIIEQLDVSVYWTTEGEVLQKINDDEKEAAASLYLNEVHKALVKYYMYRDAKNLPAFPVWPTADWMIGRYFINLDPLKVYQYQIKYNESKIETTLLELYIILMPWMTSLDLVFTYRGLITDSVDSVMDFYVLQHVYLIVKYAESNFKTDDPVQIKRLSQSIQWYTEGTKTIRNYLSFPKPRTGVSVRGWSADKFIPKIKDLSDKPSLDNFESIMQTLPEETKTKLSKWLDNLIKSPDYANKEYQVQLNLLIMDNCNAASAFVTSIHKIVFDSGIGPTQTFVDILESYCLPNLKEIFGGQSKDVISFNLQKNIREN